MSENIKSKILSGSFADAGTAFNLVRDLLEAECKMPGISVLLDEGNDYRIGAAGMGNRIVGFVLEASEGGGGLPHRYAIRNGNFFEDEVEYPVLFEEPRLKLLHGFAYTTTGFADALGALKAEISHCAKE